MQCHLKRLTLVLLGLSLSSCSHSPPSVDSFCKVYNQVVLAKGEGAISAAPSVKRRILANELTYRDLCLPKK